MEEFRILFPHKLQAVGLRKYFEISSNMPRDWTFESSSLCMYIYIAGLGKVSPISEATNERNANYNFDLERRKRKPLRYYFYIIYVEKILNIWLISSHFSAQNIRLQYSYSYLKSQRGILNVYIVIVSTQNSLYCLHFLKNEKLDVIYPLDYPIQLSCLEVISSYDTVNVHVVQVPFKLFSENYLSVVTVRFVLVI